MSHRAAGAEANGCDNDELWEVCILTYFQASDITNPVQFYYPHKREKEEHIATRKVRNMFAEFEATPQGLSIEERIRRTLTKEELEREQAERGH